MTSSWCLQVSMLCWNSHKVYNVLFRLNMFTHQWPHRISLLSRPVISCYVLLSIRLFSTNFAANVKTVISHSVKHSWVLWSRKNLNLKLRKGLTWLCLDSNSLHCTCTDQHVVYCAITKNVPEIIVKKNSYHACSSLYNNTTVSHWRILTLLLSNVRHVLTPLCGIYRICNIRTQWSTVENWLW